MILQLSFWLSNIFLIQSYRSDNYTRAGWPKTWLLVQVNGDGLCKIRGLRKCLDMLAALTKNKSKIGAENWNLTTDTFVFPLIEYMECNNTTLICNCSRIT